LSLMRIIWPGLDSPPRWFLASAGPTSRAPGNGPCPPGPSSCKTRAKVKSMMLITAASVVLYTGLAVWGCGGWAAFIAHLAGAGASVAMGLISVAAMFTSGNISSGRREDSKTRWIFLPFLVLGFVLAWLPAYTDRRDLWTIDGDAVRYLGL